MGAGAEVDNGQAPVANTNITLDPLPLAIRAAVRDGIGHLFQDDRRGRRAVEVNKAGYAAHG